MGVAAAQYAEQLQGLLPQGAAWPRDPNAVLTQLLRVFADELARVHVRGLDLLDEADPRDTFELLPDWERVAGLPDDCTPSAATIAERIGLLVQRLTEQGGQSRQFFIDLAALLGFDITITEYRAARFGGSRFGDEFAGEDAIFAWQVNVAAAFTGSEPRFGEAVFGETFGGITPNDVLECAIRRAVPAHTKVFFKYGA